MTDFSLCTRFSMAWPARMHYRLLNSKSLNMLKYFNLSGSLFVICQRHLPSGDIWKNSTRESWASQALTKEMNCFNVLPVGSALLWRSHDQPSGKLQTPNWKIINLVSSESPLTGLALVNIWLRNFSHYRTRRSGEEQNRVYWILSLRWGILVRKLSW